MQKSMNKRKIRDCLRLAGAILWSWIYTPHMLFSFSNKNIMSDVRRNAHQISVNLPEWLMLLYFLHNNAYFRTLFYFRIGAVKALFISWYRPGDRYFSISSTTKIGQHFQILHPYSTVLNAESIGDNFSCLHCTTIGSTHKGRPTIGNNVSLGASVTIIGNVNIGNNVDIGAGSVVVKDIPDNCIAVGNPAKVIKVLC